jgi:hypothetical protein
MWAPLVALQTSKRYSISCHTRPRTSGVTDAATSLIRVSSAGCCEYEHCTRPASHIPRNKNPGVSGPESAIFCKSLGVTLDTLRAQLLALPPSLPSHHYPQFHQPRDGKLGEFVLHLTPVSCVRRVSFQQYNHLKPHHDFWDTLYILNELKDCPLLKKYSAPWS